MRILIVEDELKIRNGMAKLITAHTEHQVAGEAKNGKEGLEMIQRLYPDLVITDIRMPQMDGLEMVEALSELGIHCHIIILSGYSEFEYARRAIRFGVDDYLLKPLAPEDVIGMLEKIQSLIEKEEKQRAGTIEGLISSIVAGNHPVRGEDVEWLRKSGGFLERLPCFLLMGYIGRTGPQYKMEIAGMLEWMQEERERSCCRYVVQEHLQQVVCLLQGEWTKQELAGILERRLYRHLAEWEQPVWTLEQMGTLEALAETGRLLKERRYDGMHLGYRSILTGEQQVQAEEYLYPRQLEMAVKNAVCRSEAQEVKACAESFVQAIREKKWEPRNYRHAYGKHIRAIDNLMQDMDSEAYRMIQGLEVEQKLAEAVTLGELEEVFEKVIQVVCARCNRKDDIRNYVILRAIHYIKEHYQENISLEMLAEYLAITPEYLSTLFNREMGKNFSVFLKEFRISHAKRLLKGSSKKIYEIAAMVGYQDPKYFNRVFKEETGLSPGDYRQQE